MASAPSQRSSTQPKVRLVTNRAAVAQPATSFAWMAVLAVVLVFVSIHVVCINRYGFFRDELYYIACAKRLDWGYVDQPPLSVVMLRLIAGPAGYPLWLVRTPAIACGAFACIASALTARQLGGKNVAQFLAAVCVVAAPTTQVVTHLYSMNSIDILIWSLAALVWSGMEKPSVSWRWPIIGVLVGIAVLNKLSGLWLFGGLAVATLLTPRREDLRQPGPWIALVVMGLGLAPYVIWQAEHHWITLEFMKNAFAHKLLPIKPTDFLLRELIVNGPASWPLWIIGVGAAAISAKWRPMALVYLFVLSLLLLSGKSRENYLAPAYFFIFAPGAVTLESWLPKVKPLIYSYGAVLSAVGAAVCCITMPLLPEATTADLISRLRSLSPEKIPSSEVGAKNNLEGLADMHGWPEMAAAVDQVYLSLTPSERAKTVVYTHNYGEAAAIERFTSIHHLKVLGRHNNYWLWGPGDWDGSVAIVVGDVPPLVVNSFDSFVPVKTLSTEFAAPEEGKARIAVARGLHKPVNEFWIESRRID